MVIKITENTVVKNENILLIGGCGCGKTRYFVNPILVDGDFTFLLMDFYETNLTELIPNSEIIEFKEEIDCENISEKLNKKINIFANIPVNPRCNSLNNVVKTEKKQIGENIKNVLENLIQKENQRPVLCILDMFGCFDFSFIDSELIKKANSKNIYFVFILQNINQLTNKDVLEHTNVKLLFGQLSDNNYEYFKDILKGSRLDENNFKSCLVLINDKVIWDKKLIAIDESPLKYQRLKEGFSQVELAQVSDIALRCIKEYEQKPNKINKAQAITLYKLAKTLNCKIEQLLIL